ncbi:hypothetical protein Goari_008706 [Gossypium aridum]|uniref:Cytochrome c oxidase subunit Vb n=2 Tax=Gossypium TaxID=3633 RepID=A0A7J8XUT1_GOSAI|nr:hypothetical protein [Gossypium aridum]
MWRRLLIPQLKTLTTVPRRSPSKTPLLQFKCSVSPLPSSSLLTRHSCRVRVEDVMPIATGHEREELAAELEVMFPLPVSDSNCRGKKIIEDVNNPVGPFGTKEAPAVVKSYYDKRIVGCPGGEGEDEHDVVWFWLEKGKLHECPVCSQYFVLEVVGPGGPPDGHGDDRH